MMSELWVAVETSMRAIRSGGGVARGAKAVESLKKNHILGGNGSLANREVKNRSFREVIRNIDHIRSYKII